MGKRGKWGKICKHCGQEVSDEWAAKRTSEWVERRKITVQKRRDAGLPVGRPKVADDKEILQLRALGWSNRKIAKHLGISTTPVHNAIRAAKP